MNQAEIFRIETPSKINLHLAVKGRRPDGYHDIETLFFPLKNPSDTITVTVSEGDGISVSCPNLPVTVPSGMDNICGRAASEYLKSASKKASVSVEIIKNIPVAAGMGGGSSDAAATLLLLQKKYGALTENELAEIAVKIGADVPFFLSPAPSVGRGVGEKLERLESMPESLPILIAAPQFPVSAAWAYKNLDRAAADNDKRSMDELISALKNRDFKQASGLLRNDLSHSILRKFPLLRMIFRELEATDGTPLVSGSGPTVFAMYPDFDSRDNAAESIRLYEFAKSSGIRLIRPE